MIFLSAAACSGEPKSLLRVAVLPCSVLIPDASADWMGSGVPAVFAEDLATSREYAPVIAADDSTALLANARYTLRTSVQSHNGQFVVSAILTDLANQRAVLTRELNGPLQAGLLPVLNQLAKDVDKDAAPFATRNEQAFSLYSRAIGAPVQQRPPLLQQAIATDAGFGMAYLALMEAFGQGDQAGLRQTAAQVQMHLGQFTPLDQARAKVALLRLSQAPPGQQQQALLQLANIAPGEVSALAALSALNASELRYTDADAWLNRALQLEPASAELLRQRAMLQFSEGHFADAEKTYRALGPANAPILEIAACRLMQGDVQGANALFNQYASIDQPFLPLARATWLIVTGNRTQAIAFLKGNLSPIPQVRSLGLSQLAVWSSAVGDTATAEISAQEALRLAGNTGVPRQVAETAALIALSGKDWNAFQKAIVQVQPATAHSYIAGFALFLRGRYAEAAQVWGRRLATLGDGTSRVMYAASLIRAGKKDEAKRVGAPLLVPNLLGGDLFVFVTFPETLRAKAEIAAQNGEQQVASSYARLMQMYVR